MGLIDVPHTTSQWLGFLSYAIIEYGLGNTKFGSVIGLISEAYKWLRGSKNGNS